jgi:general secretion pathway protein C
MTRHAGPALADRLPALLAAPAMARAAAIACGALALWLLARVLLLAIAGPALPLGAGASDPGLPAPAAVAAPVAGWQLFGRAAAPAQAAVARGTALPLLLRGTLASDDPAAGLAMIAEPGEPERAYRVGDVLPGGAVLEAVRPGDVLLRRDGVQESLALARAEGLAGTSRAAAPPVAAAAGAVEQVPGAGFLVGMPAFGSPDFETDRAQRAPLLAALAAEAQLFPVLEGGRVTGVRLGVRDPAVLAPLGLENGDIITAVDGIPVDGPERLPELQQRLEQGGRLSLSVRRGALDLTLSVGL